MTYNLTGLGTSNDPYTFFVAANSAVDGLFGALTIIAVFIVILLAALQSGRNEPQEAFFYASLISFFVGLFFSYMGLASIIWAVAPAIMGALAIIAMALKK